MIISAKLQHVQNVIVNMSSGTNLQSWYYGLFLHCKAHMWHAELPQYLSLPHSV